jgi:N-methylhydantoinase B
MSEVIDHAERLTRSALRELPDGQWSFADWFDDDGVELDKPIRLFVTMTKQGDHMLVDWTGTDPQVKGAINNTLSFTKAASYTAIRSVLPANIPNNEGVFRAIEVVAPPGTIANGVLPAACAARGLTGFRMVDCAFGCLAMMLPDKVFAASDGGNTGISIGGYHADRSPFIYVDFTCGAWGGRPWADGLDGNSNMFANMASHSVEVTEAEQPIRIEAYEFVPDKAGPGKFRGGVPFRRDYRFLEDEGILQVRSDRHRIPPYGLYGGQPGKPSQNHLNPETENRAMPSKLTMTIHEGDVFRHEVAGAGGYGDPLERDPAAGARDVLNVVVSRAAARADYGVVIDGRGQVEPEATLRLRVEQRRTRGWNAIPIVTRG